MKSGPLSILATVGLSLIALCDSSGAACPAFHQLQNGQTADAAQVMDNFNYLLNCPNFTGSVGIGTSSPLAALHVVNSAGSTLSLEKPGGAALQFLRAGTNKFLIEDDSAAGAPALGFYAWNGSGWNNLVNFGVNGNVGIGTTFSNGLLNFQANGTTTLLSATRSDNTQPGYFKFNGWGSFSISNGLAIGYDWPNSLQSGMIINGNVGIGTSSPAYTLDVNGTVRAANVSPASDRRLKKDIAPLALDAVTKIAELQPVTFRWISPKDDGMQGVQIGLIAQDVEKILPTTVTTANDKARTKAIKYNEITALLIKAVQEQQKIIANQDAKIASLTRKNAEFEARLARIERSRLAAVQ